MNSEDIRKIVIAGAGIMGASMAQAFALKGFDVTMYNHREITLEKARNRINAAMETLVENGEITGEQGTSALNSLKYTASEDCFKDFDLLVESIVENADIKKDFYRTVSGLAKEDAIIATNTSALPITDLQEAVKAPERFLGMHWFNPPNLIPLIEIIRGDKTGDDAVNAVYGISEKIGKKPVVVKKDVKGFAANRIQLAVLREALHLVENDVISIEDLDKVMKYGIGPRYAFLGPFEVVDLGGLDTFHSIGKGLFPDLCNAAEVSPLLSELVDNGHFGVKAQKGFYDYGEGKDAEAIKRRDEILLKLSKILFE